MTNVLMIDPAAHEASRDWADKLAAEIIREHARYGKYDGFAEMLALRLRIVHEQGRHEGEIAGINQGFDSAQEVIDRQFPRNDCQGEKVPR